MEIYGKKSGPYERREFFHLKQEKQFGFVGQKAGRVEMVINGKSTPVRLGEFFPPVRILDAGLTVAVVGTFVQGKRKEVWVRAVPVE